MNSLLQKKRLLLAILPMSLLSLAGCGTVTSERPCIGLRPKLEPLSEQTLQAMQPNSTAYSAKVLDFSKKAESSLNSVMDKSVP